MKHFEDPRLSIAQAGLEQALQRHLSVNAEATDSIQVKAFSNHEDIVEHESMQAFDHMLHHVHTNQKVPDEKPTHLEATEHVWGVLKLYYAIIEARLAGNHRRARMLRERLAFSTGDPGWIEALIDYIDAFDMNPRHKIPYRRWQSIDEFVIKGFETPCKIALIGDWGTGTKIAKTVLKQAMHHQPDALVHMGDVYYAGTEQQYRHKFRHLIDELAVNANGERIPVYNLPGNHDMYSGGEAYYAELGVTNESCPDKAQGASYFALEIDGGRWQLLSCDTAYHDHDVFTVNIEVTSVTRHEQDWLEHQVKRVAKVGGKNILLSHHQPFSAFEATGSMSRKSPQNYWVNPNLVDMYRRLASHGNMAAWFWGHEHRFAIYDPYADIPLGRCIGHGAVPMLTEEDPYKVRETDWKSVPLALLGFLRGKWRPHSFRGLGLYAKSLVKGEFPNPPQLTSSADGTPIKIKEASEHIMWRHGYVILDFTEDGATASYYDDVDPDPMYTESL